MSVVVKATLLSAPPRRGSVAAAVASVWVPAMCSAELWRDRIGLAPFLPASRRAVLEEREVWRPFTTVLVHADLPHLGSNAVPLAILSYLVYGYFGAWVHPVLSWPLGAVVAFLALLTMDPDVQLVGASGVVYLLAGFWLTSYLFIERRFSPVRRLMRALGMALIFLVPPSIDPSVSHLSHALGFAFGAVLGTVHFALRWRIIRAWEIVEKDGEEMPGYLVN